MTQIEKANLIIKTVCDDFGQDILDVKGKRVRREYVTPRHFAMYYIRKFTNIGLTDTGVMFLRDHATVMHAVTTVENLISHNGYKVVDERLTKKIIKALYPNQRSKELRTKRIRYHYRRMLRKSRLIFKVSKLAAKC